MNKLIEKTEIIVMLIFSFIAVLLLNIDVLIRFITNNDNSSYEYFHDRLSELIDTPLTWLNDHFLTPSVATFVLWAVIGLICYTILYFFADIKSEVSEILSEGKNNINPNNKLYRSRKLKIVVNSFILLVTIIAIFVMLFLSLNKLLPYSSTKVYLSLYDSISLLTRAWFIVESFIALFIIPLTFLTIIRISNQLRK